MLAIRLQRVGRKNDPHFRVVVTDSKKAPKSGSFIEILGWRDPKAHTHDIKKERVEYWISKGAKPSDTVHSLLVETKVVIAAKRKKGKSTKQEIVDQQTPAVSVGEAGDKSQKPAEKAEA